MKIGYARISTKAQNIQMQVDALEQAGCHKIFEETESGAKSDRKVINECLRYLRPGDSLVVWSIDRLSRKKKDTDDILVYLKERDIGLISLKENLNTKEKMGELVLNILIAIAESERERIIERTHAGLLAARQRGKLMGRKHKKDLKTRQSIRDLYKTGNYTYNDLMKMYDISRVTLYKYIHEKR